VQVLVEPAGVEEVQLPGPPEADEVVRATIEDFYLTKQKRSLQKTCLEVIRRCRNAGLPPPHPNTVRNRIALISDQLKLDSREGRQAAREKYAPLKGVFPGADWPLAVVQIDHTKLDIVLVDDITRRPIGRPWITLAIDVFSRIVAGMHVSFDPPSASSVGLCLAHAILPKESWLVKRGIAAPWPVWGVPACVHVDNAKEFRGKMLGRACEQYGIRIDWRPVATPHFGGHIERLLGTFLREIHNLPGTTFSNPMERGRYDHEKEASLTLSEFDTWLGTFIVEVYHQRPHSAIGVSPIKRYEEGILGSAERPARGLPPKIADEERLRLDFMPYVERTVQPYGIVIDEVHYYSDSLRGWINATDPGSKGRKRTFIVRRDPRDISVVWFWDPEIGQYMDVPYRDTSRPAISVWELREASRRLKAEGLAQISEDLIIEAYDRMRALEETAVREPKRARLSRHRRAANREALEGLPRGLPAPYGTGGGLAAPPIPAEPVKPFEEMEEIL
jgi:putative transposase